MLPFIVWPIEVFFPYPYLVEEIAKGILVYFILSIPSQNVKLGYGLLIGLCFALSENVLYSINFFTIGTVSFFLQRIASTGILHAGTAFLITAASLKNKKLIILGIILASAIHFVFNTFI